MPAYEYNCPKCNKIVIKQRSIKENDPGYTCETCNSALTRVYSNTEVIFNGSGFYKTDYGKK